MKRTRNPEEKRRKLIKATKRILREGGYFTKFSLEQVAQEAGVSKGGLLHHFPDKESLLRAASRDSTEQFEVEYGEELAQEDETAGRYVRAYIRAALDTRHQRVLETSPVLLAFLRSSDNEADVKTRFAHWQEQIEQDKLDPVLATIIRFAVDGLLYTEIIDAQPIDSELREQVIQRLTEMASPKSN